MDGNHKWMGVGCFLARSEGPLAGAACQSRDANSTGGGFHSSPDLALCHSHSKVVTAKLCLMAAQPGGIKGRRMQTVGCGFRICIIFARVLCSTSTTLSKVYLIKK